MAAMAIVMSPEELEAAIARALEPLRLEMERLRGGDPHVLVPFPEAARRLGVDLRTVQRRAKDGRLEVVEVGGERMARLPATLGRG